MTERPPLAKVGAMARAIVADMHVERSRLTPALIAGIRNGEGDVDNWFSVQAAQRAIDAVQAGAVVDGKGCLIWPEARRG